MHKKDYEIYHKVKQFLLQETTPKQAQRKRKHTVVLNHISFFSLMGPNDVKEQNIDKTSS